MEGICRILDDVEPMKDEEDELCWKADKFECFTVNSCYIKMDPCLTDLTQDCLAALAIIWKLKVPPKIQIFGWRLTRDRLSTRDQLLKR